jgi:hypothetical protein
MTRIGVDEKIALVGFLAIDDFVGYNFTRSEIDALPHFRFRVDYFMGGNCAMM